MTTTLNQNNLSTVNFKLNFKRLPNVEYRVQSVAIPGMEMGSVDRPSPFVRIPYPGNLTYGDLSVTFLVGESLADYLEIFNWMVLMGHPDELPQYDHEKIFSDCNVVILNSSRTSEVSVRFTDAFPISLSPLTFDSTLTDVQYATATATFKFGRFYYDLA